MLGRERQTQTNYRRAKNDSKAGKKSRRNKTTATRKIRTNIKINSRYNTNSEKTYYNFLSNKKNK